MRFLADEDFDNRIIRGVLRRIPELDMVRVQDTEIAAASDAEILIWAANEQRVLLTHDVNTLTFHFTAHLQRGLSSPGVIFVSQSLAISQVIDDLVIIALYSIDGEYTNQMRFLPLE